MIIHMFIMQYMLLWVQDVFYTTQQNHLTSIPYTWDYILLPVKFLVESNIVKFLVEIEHNN